jgi:hypothetical protein
VRRVLALVLVIAVARPAVASVVVEDARATGHLLADDDLFVDRGWWSAPLDGGAFGVSTSITLARTNGPNGALFRWGFDVVVQIPFERFFGRKPRAPAGPRWKEDPMIKKRWGAMAALPGALAIAGGAAAKGKLAKIDTVAPAPSTSSLTLAPVTPMSTATIVTTSAPSVAGVVAVTAPIVTSPLPPNAVRSLVAAAWKAAGVDRDDALSDLAARARASALAPEVRLRAYRSIDAGARLYRAEDTADKATVTDGTQNVFEARLSWRLDRLVFADEEVAIERIRLERTELKQRIAGKIVELAIRWQRARRAANDPELLPAERDEAAIVAVECLLGLEALTGGAATSILLSPSP